MPSLTIGITARHGDEAWITSNTRHYLARLAELDARPVILVPDAPALLPSGARLLPDGSGRLPDAVLDELDGLILSGGGDVHPRYFGQELAGADAGSIDERRDELELNLARAALARDLPLFGICRGCQVLNVAAGGSMVQHLEGHRSPLDNPWLHDVRLVPGSRLAALLESPRFAVNTYHHQAVDAATLAPGMRAAAVADTSSKPLQGTASILEAFEGERHRWVVGVQWHPERSFELPVEHTRLWAAFAAACRSANEF